MLNSLMKINSCIVSLYDMTSSFALMKSSRPCLVTSCFAFITFRYVPLYEEKELPSEFTHSWIALHMCYSFLPHMVRIGVKTRVNGLVAAKHVHKLVVSIFTTMGVVPTFCGKRGYHANTNINSYRMV